MPGLFHAMNTTYIYALLITSYSFYLQQFYLDYSIFIQTKLKYVLLQLYQIKLSFTLHRLSIYYEN